MLTIRFSLTPEDYADLERQRRGRIGRQIFRISFGSIAGSVGALMIWAAIFFFPRNRPFGNVLVAIQGLLCLWGGMEAPGLVRLFALFSDPYAPCELQIESDQVAFSRNGKIRQFRWNPSQGLGENEAFFFLQTRHNEMRWAIPKRCVTNEQQLKLQELVRKGSTETRHF